MKLVKLKAESGCDIYVNADTINIVRVKDKTQNTCVVYFGDSYISVQGKLSAIVSNLRRAYD